MARVIDPLRSAQAAGKLGGTVYRNRGAQSIVSSKTAPGAQMSPAQIQVRATTRAANIAWRAAAAPYKLHWQQFANRHQVTSKWGQLITWSGHNWFVRNYCYRVRNGLTPIVDAPPDYSPSTLASLNVVDSTPVLNLSWVIGYNSGHSCKCEIYVNSYPHRHTTILGRERCRLVATVDISASPYTHVPNGYGAYTYYVRAVDNYSSLFGFWHRIAYDFELTGGGVYYEEIITPPSGGDETAPEE